MVNIFVLRRKAINNPGNKRVIGILVGTLTRECLYDLGGGARKNQRRRVCPRGGVANWEYNKACRCFPTAL